MTYLQWDLGVDRVFRAIPSIPDITASDVSVAIVMIQDVAFICSFAWLASTPMFVIFRNDADHFTGFSIVVGRST